jgi:hypothetical protein
VSLVLSLLGRIPAWVWLVVALTAWGWNNGRRLEVLKGEIAKERLVAAEAARETERLLNKSNAQIADELYKAQKNRDAAAAAVAKRLRELVAAKSASDTTLAACRNHAGPAVQILPDSARDALVEFARDADEVADRLRACQSYVKEVKLSRP